MRLLFIFLFSLGLANSLPAQFKKQSAAGEAPGPWLFGTIGVGKDAEGKPLTTALKGLAVKVGEHGEASVCYDLDLCRMAGGWSGGKFVTPMNLMSRGEYPVAMGKPAFLTGDLPGFGFQEKPAVWHWGDDRQPEPFGPLPHVRYRGLSVHGNRVVLKWLVNEVEVLESPWFEKRGEMEVFTRTFSVAPSREALLLTVCRLPAGEEKADPAEDITFFSAKPSDRLIERRGFTKFFDADRVVVATDAGLPEGATWENRQQHLVVTLPPHPAPVHFRILIGTGPEKMDTLPPLTAEPPLEDLAALSQPGPVHWPETVETKGELSKSTEAYVVDSVHLPEPNPWDAPMFTSAFDFFPDGRAAICTFHGDVFLVAGLDAGLEHVTWKHFATGLYHPLGLKIVKGDVYVSGRDGITRLRDLNGDGEADAYEVFNWDLKVTKSFHEFVFDLQTDSTGNFYFAKAGPVKNGGRGFDQISEHHGCLFEVSADGRHLDVIATGFRAPNGLSVGPNSEITTSDNEGTWTPACRLNWIIPDGFYGVVDLAHRPQPPAEYNKPLCWLPKRVDNSSAGQVWVTSKKWGPWEDHLLHLSYGQSALFGVMAEPVDDLNAPDCCSHLMQGGVVKFPLRFESGVMRARFNPTDGQLYVTGLRGWQTNAVRNGCLQRVRYTGAPVYQPIELHARKGGVEVKFACSLDTQQACDPDNWQIEAWNYIWSSAYGSPEISTKEPPVKPAEPGKNGEMEYSPAQMKKSQHDSWTVRRVTAGTDDRSVFLEIPEIKPVMQMSIKYRLHASDGADLSGEIVNSIHVLSEEP